MRLRRLRRFAASVAALVLGAAGLGAAPLAGAAAGQRGDRVLGRLLGDQPVEHRVHRGDHHHQPRLAADVAGRSATPTRGNQQLAQGWNGTWSQTGQNVTVTNASWNGSLATNGTVQPSAPTSTTRGTNTSPTAFTLNGVACTGQTTGSRRCHHREPASLSVVQGSTGTVGVSLSSAPSANVTVSVTAVVTAG